MLKVNTNQMSKINASQNLTADCVIDGKTAAQFSGNYSVGMMHNYSMSKSISDYELYSENTDTVNEDYKEFENYVEESMLKLKAAIENIQQQEDSGLQ